MMRCAILMAIMGNNINKFGEFLPREHLCENNDEYNIIDKLLIFGKQ